MPPRQWRDEELEKWLGVPSVEMWDTFAPSLPQSMKDESRLLVGQEMHRLVAEGKARLYPGAAEALARLKDRGYTLVFLSNCDSAYMAAHRQAFDLDRYFAGFYCGEAYDWRPKPEIFDIIRRSFGGPYCVVGDRARDMDIARTHGLKAVGCAYGYGSPEELADADITVQSVQAVPEAVERLIPLT